MTAPDADVGARIGRALVEEGLAACVNVLPQIRSIYVWKGAVSDEAEALCLIKTRAALFPQVERRVKELHPYDVPELLGFAPSQAHAPYLAWIEASTKGALPDG